MTKSGLVRATLALAATAAMAGTAVAKTPADFTQRDRDDVTCLIIVSAVLDDMSADPNSSAEEQSGLTSVVTYFLGKAVGRNSEAGIGQLLHPDFVRTLPVDSTSERLRCSREASKMGEDFAKAGEALQVMD